MLKRLEPNVNIAGNYFCSNRSAPIVKRRNKLASIPIWEWTLFDEAQPQIVAPIRSVQLTPWAKTMSANI
jgi:hypothetical protein